MAEYKRVRHTFEPVYDDHSSVLILGTFPSVKSREQNFYYGHPGTRFWRVLAKVTGQPMPETIEEKRAFLLANGIALWDVIAECDIAGSSDSSIRNVVPAPLEQVLFAARIQKIFANGAKAWELYHRFALPRLLPLLGPDQRETAEHIQKLPSTSPANAAWSLDRLAKAWSPVKGLAA